MTDYHKLTGSLSAYPYPRQPTNLVKGSGIFPHVNAINWLSQPHCSPPGEFIPRNSFLQQFKNKETCFEYYRRLYALGWTTNPLGTAMKMPRNHNWRMMGAIGSLVGFCACITQIWYMTAIHYPKTYCQDWAEAEVLHPRLARSHLQRSDYQPLAVLGHFDVRWPRWAKLEN